MTCPHCTTEMTHTAEDFLCPLLPADHRPVLEPPEITGEALVWDRWRCQHYRLSRLRRYTDPIVEPGVPA